LHCIVCMYVCICHQDLNFMILYVCMYVCMYVSHFSMSTVSVSSVYVFMYLCMYVCIAFIRPLVNVCMYTKYLYVSC
jgi:hypothetical protein